MVQLERIQDTIAASFEKSRAQTNVYKNLINQLQMTSDDKALLARKILGYEMPKNLIETNKLDIANEVLIFKENLPKSQNEVLEKAPLLCEYLFKESRLLNLSIKEFIERKIPRVNNHNQVKVITVGWINSDKKESSKEKYSIEEAILEVTLDDLIVAIDWFLGELERKTESARKIEDFEKLQSLEEQSIIPDHDHIDRLMGYQTTLQRQLSTTIGELIALTRTA